MDTCRSALKHQNRIKKQINDEIASLKAKEMQDLIKQENVYTGHMMTEIHSRNSSNGKKNNSLKVNEENAYLNSFYANQTRQELLISRGELYILFNELCENVVIPASSEKDKYLILLMQLVAIEQNIKLLNDQINFINAQNKALEEQKQREEQWNQIITNLQISDFTRSYESIKNTYENFHALLNATNHEIIKIDLQLNNPSINLSQKERTSLESKRSELLLFREKLEKIQPQVDKAFALANEAKSACVNNDGSYNMEKLAELAPVIKQERQELRQALNNAFKAAPKNNAEISKIIQKDGDDEKKLEQEFTNLKNIEIQPILEDIRSKKIELETLTSCTDEAESQQYLKDKITKLTQLEYKLKITPDMELLQNSISLASNTLTSMATDIKIIELSKLHAQNSNNSKLKTEEQQTVADVQYGKLYSIQEAILNLANDDTIENEEIILFAASANDICETLSKDFDSNQLKCDLSNLLNQYSLPSNEKLDRILNLINELNIESNNALEEPDSSSSSPKF